MEKIHKFDLVYDSQELFRLILHAMSNPLTKVNINGYSEKFNKDNKEFLAIAFTLLDNEMTFTTFNNKKLDEDIISLTLAKYENKSNADFIFIDDEKNIEESIENARYGTLSSPHESAIIIIKIKSSDEFKLRMSGPGIENIKQIETSKLVGRTISYRDNMNYEYPQGLDFIFVDEIGNLFSVPRLVKREEN